MDQVVSYTAPSRVAGAQRLALGVGVAGIALCAVGFAAGREQFFKSYLLAYVFWVGVSLGSLALMMVGHLSGGAWAVVIRRVNEASSRVLPFMAILFLPIALGVHELYVWSNPAVVAHDAVLQHKAPYLNVPFFLVRTAIYFIVWSSLAFLISKLSLDQEQSGEHGQALKMQRLSGGGLVLYALTVLFMSVDWIMSLDPHWFSTIYGILFMGGQGLSAMAFTIAVIVLLSRIEPMSRVIAPAHLHDLGKLMLAFVMLWAYFSFSQFLIIWSANLPEEIPWYLKRMGGGWGYVGLGLIFLHFALPFILLLSRDLKRNGRTLIGVAVAVIVMRLVDLFWLIGPLGHDPAEAGHYAGQPAILHLHWLDAVAPIAVGGIWVAIFLWQLQSRSLLPLGEPYLAEALEHGRHGH